MIAEGLIDLFFGIFRVAFGAIEIVSLPTQTIEALTTILAYGNWIVGIDIMALFSASVIFWWVFNMSIGLIVWVWNRLPLT